ncbi:GNAT family N-acetyltransferase [Streptomyces sp. NPDC087440]|uniref:GNAT family N-acetyltransferase n=1 Tax=Streptomyces sp. NPDC087440 TaxID=3365790 RepID=UPI0037FCE9A3
MTNDDEGAVLRVGGEDHDLADRLDRELTAFNNAASGASEEELSVRVTDASGELIGGLTGFTWGGLGFVHLLWVREGARHAGWGARLMRGAEEEMRRRGCTGAAVSTYTFQAPGFYERLGYEETGRLPGVPGGHEDVYLFKRL